MAEDTIVRAIIHNEGAVLVLQNSMDDPKEYAQGKWEMPGGWVEAGDASEQAAVQREVQEETGLDVTVEEELDRVRVEREGTGRDCQYYLARASTRDVTLSDEHRDARWVDPETFKGMDWLYFAGFSIPILHRIKDTI